MSGKGKGKPDLVAIYRLEFYRKQNNWKLFSDKKKTKKKNATAAAAEDPPAPVDTRDLLNETYNVECPKTDVGNSLHNKAFVESDSTTDPPSDPTPTPTQQDSSPSTTTQVTPKRKSRIWNIPWSELEEAFELGSGQEGGNSGQQETTSPAVGYSPSQDVLYGDSNSEDIWTDDWSSDEAQFMMAAHLGPHSTANEQVMHEESAADLLRELLQFADRHNVSLSYGSQDELPTHDDTYFTRNSDIILSGSHRNYIHYNLDTEYFGDDIGNIDRNIGHVDQNIGQVDQMVDRCGNNDQYVDVAGQFNRIFGQNYKYIDQYENMGNYDTNILDYNTNINQNLGGNNIASNLGQYYQHFDQCDQNIKQFDFTKPPPPLYHNKIDSNIPQLINQIDVKDDRYKDIDRNNNNVIWEGRGRGRGRNNNSNLLQAIVIGQGRPYRLK